MTMSSNPKAVLQKSASLVAERLASIRIVPEAYLEDCRIILRQDTWNATVEERGSQGWCGWPLCENASRSVTNSYPDTQKYRLSFSERAVYDLKEVIRFCSDKCYKKSDEFVNRLSKEPLTKSDAVALKHVLKIKPSELGSYTPLDVDRNAAASRTRVVQEEPEISVASKEKRAAAAKTMVENITERKSSSRSEPKVLSRKDPLAPRSSDPAKAASHDVMRQLQKWSMHDDGDGDDCEIDDPVVAALLEEERTMNAGLIDPATDSKKSKSKNRRPGVSSMFSVVHKHLSEWTSPGTLAHIHGQETWASISAALDRRYGVKSSGGSSDFAELDRMRRATGKAGAAEPTSRTEEKEALALSGHQSSQVRQSFVTWIQPSVNVVLQALRIGLYHEVRDSLLELIRHFGIRRCPSLRTEEADAIALVLLQLCQVIRTPEKTVHRRDTDEPYQVLRKNGDFFSVAHEVMEDMEISEDSWVEWLAIFRLKREC